jgi:hypothetical protein
MAGRHKAQFLAGTRRWLLMVDMANIVRRIETGDVHCGVVAVAVPRTSQKELILTPTIHHFVHHQETAEQIPRFDPFLKPLNNYHTVFS